jgi:hypothetical protein
VIGAVGKYLHSLLEDQYSAGLWRLQTSRTIVELGRVNSAVRLEWPHRLDRYTHPATILNVEMHGKLHDGFGYVEGGELVLEAPYRRTQLRIGSYSRNLLSLLSLAQRVLTRFGPLLKRRKLAQAVLMRPDFPTRAYISRSTIVPSSSKNSTLIQVAKVSETLYLLILQSQRPDGARCEERLLYPRFALLKLRPRQYDDESYIREKLTSHLRGAAYKEVTEEEWPTSIVIIV